MKHYLLTVLIVAISAFNSAAQSNVVRPFVWKVTKNGHVSYFFGSMHVGVTLEEMPKSLLDIITNSSRVVGEIGHQVPEGLSVREAYAWGNFFVKYSRTMSPLKEVVSKATWDRIVKDAASCGFNETYLETKSAVNIEVKISQEKSRTSSYGTTSIDEQIEDFFLASHPGHSVISLETEVERRLIWQTYLTPQVIDLWARAGHYSCAIKETTKEEADLMQALFSVYKRGDENVLLKFLDAVTSKNRTSEQRESSRVRQEVMIDRRTDFWMHRIKDIHNNLAGQSFFVVGLLHLVGSDGILNQLREGGYQVERLNR